MARRPRSSALTAKAPPKKRPPVIQGAPCSVCGRSERGFGVHKRRGGPIVDNGQQIRPTKQCSRECQVLQSLANEIGSPINPNEAMSIRDALPAVCDYLDSIGKSDIYAMTTEEVERFGEIFYVGVCCALRDRVGDRMAQDIEDLPKRVQTQLEAALGDHIPTFAGRS